ncbi:MAG: hypothetical protein KC416_12215 [Myxococcales bacterium]|nr:hypothetical protein [Myxococcales bacterium]
MRTSIALRANQLRGVANDTGVPPQYGGGMNLRQAAEWLCVDRRTLPKCLVDIPVGVTPGKLKPGQVPARRIGSQRRVFKSDVLGFPNSKNGSKNGRARTENMEGCEEARTSEKLGASSWDRQMGDLRNRYRPED